jgi:hypothetical protein
MGSAKTRQNTSRNRLATRKRAPSSTFAESALKNADDLINLADHRRGRESVLPRERRTVFGSLRQPGDRPIFPMLVRWRTDRLGLAIWKWSGQVVSVSELPLRLPDSGPAIQRRTLAKSKAMVTCVSQLPVARCRKGKAIARRHIKNGPGKGRRETSNSGSRIDI